MKKINSIIAIISIASLIASCSHDQTPSLIVADGEVEVEMNIATPGMGRTRASIPQENMIDSIRVLVFDASGASDEGDATFLYHRHTWKYGTNYRTILKTGTDLNIYFMANTNNSLLAAIDSLDTFDDVREKLILTNPKNIPNNKLPMWGSVLGVSISESATYESLGTINLLRSVASADLTITAPPAEFGFEEAMLVWATDKGYLAHWTDSVNSAGKIKSPEVPAGADYELGNDFTWKYTPVSGAILNKFYMFENNTTAATAASSPNGRNYTKLIVAGKYNSGATTYYPLALRDSIGNKVQAARNRKFEIEVTKVNGDGYPTPEEALNAEDVNMTYNVIIWDGGYIDSDIIIDGPHYVSFSGGKTILVANEPLSDAIHRFTTNALEWTGNAPDNLRWKIDSGTEVTGSTVSNDRFTVTITKDTDDTTGEGYYLTVTASKDYTDAAGGSHEATLSLTIGRIKFDIKLKQVENGWKDGGNQDENL